MANEKLFIALRNKTFTLRSIPFSTKAKIGLKSTLLSVNIISNLRIEDLETAKNYILTTSNSNDDIENKDLPTYL